MINRLFLNWKLWSRSWYQHQIWFRDVSWTLKKAETIWVYWRLVALVMRHDIADACSYIANSYIACWRLVCRGWAIPHSALVTIASCYFALPVSLVVSTQFHFVASFLNSVVLTVCTRFCNYVKPHQTVLFSLSCVGGLFRLEVNRDWRRLVWLLNFNHVKSQTRYERITKT